MMVLGCEMRGPNITSPQAVLQCPASRICFHRLYTCCIMYSTVSYHSLSIHLPSDVTHIHIHHFLDHFPQKPWDFFFISTLGCPGVNQNTGRKYPRIGVGNTLFLLGKHAPNSCRLSQQNHLHSV